MGKQSSAKAAAQREGTWRDRLARFSSSGQKVEAFCRDEGVSAWSFYQWRKRLGAAGQRSEARASSTSFIDVGAMPAPPGGAERAHGDGLVGMEIRIELGGGIVVQLARR